MAKGASKAAQNQVGVDNAYAKQYNQRASTVSDTLFPFLTGEMNDPQGFGQETLDKMETQGGEATSGALGAGKESAELLGERTGNTAAIPGIIDSTTRDAMKQQSDNALGISTQNAKLKEMQRQAGASGTEGLYSEDVKSALSALGLSTDSINAWTGADKASQDATMGWAKLGLNAAGTAAGA